MRVSLIAAMAENRVIGRDNGLPWHISADLKHFRRLTLGKPVVMGRKTFESIGRPLPGRPNVVLSRASGFPSDGITVCTGLDAGLDAAATLAGECGADEIMVIGGEAVYAAALARADRLYLTLVQGDFEGDAYFPPFDRRLWTETAREDHPPEKPGSPGFSFVRLETTKA